MKRLWVNLEACLSWFCLPLLFHCHLENVRLVLFHWPYQLLLVHAMKLKILLAKIHDLICLTLVWNLCCTMQNFGGRKFWQISISSPKYFCSNLIQYSECSMMKAFAKILYSKLFAKFNLPKFYSAKFCIVWYIVSKLSNVLNCMIILQ